MTIRHIPNPPNTLHRTLRVPRTTILKSWSTITFWDLSSGPKPLRRFSTVLESNPVSILELELLGIGDPNPETPFCTCVRDPLSPRFQKDWSITCHGFLFYLSHDCCLGVRVVRTTRSPGMLGVRIPVSSTTRFKLQF